MVISIGEKLILNVVSLSVCVQKKVSLWQGWMVDEEAAVVEVAPMKTVG